MGQRTGLCNRVNVRVSIRIAVRLILGLGYVFGLVLGLAPSSNSTAAVNIASRCPFTVP